MWRRTLTPLTSSAFYTSASQLSAHTHAHTHLLYTLAGILCEYTYSHSLSTDKYAFKYMHSPRLAQIYMFARFYKNIFESVRTLS